MAPRSGCRRIPRRLDRCVVGPGAASEVGSHAAQLGKRAFVLGATPAVDAVRQPLLSELEQAGVTSSVEAGEHIRKTLQAADALTAISGARQAEVVVSSGGGAVID